MLGNGTEVAVGWPGWVCRQRGVSVKQSPWGGSQGPPTCPQAFQTVRSAPTGLEVGGHKPTQGFQHDVGKHLPWP